MGMEIERKFLVKHLPLGWKNQPSAVIRQGYVLACTDGTELRVRQKDDRFFQTIKQGQGLQRVEIEIELNRRQFESLWPHTAGRRVAKTRFNIPLGAATAQLDVFDGALAGLRLVEVEFDSIADSRRFALPAWFGREVTEDSRFKNRYLATEGIPKDTPHG